MSRWCLEWTKDKKGVMVVGIGMEHNSQYKPFIRNRLKKSCSSSLAFWFVNTRKWLYILISALNRNFYIFRWIQPATCKCSLSLYINVFSHCVPLPQSTVFLPLSILFHRHWCCFDESEMWNSSPDLGFLHLSPEIWMCHSTANQEQNDTIQDTQFQCSHTHFQYLLWIY